MQFAGPSFTFPLTADQLDASLADPARYAFAIMENETNSTIGHAEIYLSGSAAWLGRILLGDPAHRGKGLGRQVVIQLVEYAFTILGQETIKLNVFDWNAPAIRCYAACGFTINAGPEVIREVNGKQWRVVNMQLTRERWDSGQTP